MMTILAPRSVRDFEHELSRHTNWRRKAAATEIRPKMAHHWHTLNQTGNTSSLSSLEAYLLLLNFK